MKVLGHVIFKDKKIIHCDTLNLKLELYTTFISLYPGGSLWCMMDYIWNVKNLKNGSIIAFVSDNNDCDSINTVLKEYYNTVNITID